MENTEFKPFPKIARWHRPFVITEKLDGTNASIYIGPDGEFLTGSRTRWITPQDDNYGFSRWAHDHKDELMLLGPGTHFGEWWGGGIQRGYGLLKGEKQFSLFNTTRWSDKELPSCVSLVPVLWDGLTIFDDITGAAESAISNLREEGSVAAPGFMKPEGIIIFHVAANLCFKQTLEKDESHKGEVK